MRSYVSVLQLEDTIKAQFVSLTLWLLQHPDESARKNMALFWTFAFGFKILLDTFDAQSGFQVLLTELKQLIAPPADGDDTPFPRMLVHHFCMCIRDYFRMQLINLAMPTLQTSLPENRAPTPRYRFLTVTDDMIAEATENLLQSEIPLPQWQWFEREGGLTIMLQIIERSRSGSSVTLDSSRMCTDILSLLTIDKSAHSALLMLKIQPLARPPEDPAPELAPPPAKSAFSVIMDSFAHPHVESPQTTASALKLLLNYVSERQSAPPLVAGQSSVRRQGARMRTPHHHHHHHVVTEASEPTPPPQTRNKDLPDTFRAAIRNIRAKNGISMLVRLLKLNWVSPPVAVTPQGADPSDVRLAIVQVMLGLAKDSNICQVLRKKVARVLPDLLKNPATSTTGQAQTSFERLRSATLRLIGVLKGEDAVRLADLESRSGQHHSLSQLDRAAIVSATPIKYSNSELLQLVVRHLQGQGLGRSALTLVEEAGLPRELAEPLPEATAATPANKRKRVVVGNAISSKDDEPEPKRNAVTLDGIVRQFLHDQHRSCARPYSFVPQFPLTSPHVCPEPTRNDRAAIAPTNIARRIWGQQLGARYSFNNTKSAWRHFKYSRLRPLREQYGLEDTQLSSVEFVSADKLLLAGELGDVFIFDLNKTEVTDPAEFQCYEEAVDCRVCLDKSTRSRLLTYTWAQNQTKLWDLNKMGAPVSTLPTMCAVFNNRSDGILGTVQPGHVGLFDALTCQQVVSLYDPDSQNNDPDRVVVPMSSPDDALVICDAALWDSRAGKGIHKFDMFTDEAFEAFHPSGNEVIINSEVWDLRTFKLLKTCPHLDQSFFTFNHSGDVIFAGFQKKSAKGLGPTSIFRSIDATTYELLKEQPMDYNLVDFAVHPEDASLAIVEKVWQRNSFCRIWDVGRTRSFDDDDDDLDDEDADEDDSLGELADVLDAADDDDDDGDEDAGDEDELEEDDDDGLEGLEGSDDAADDGMDVDEFDEEEGDGIEELDYGDVMQLLQGVMGNHDDDDEDNDSDIDD